MTSAIAKNPETLGMSFSLSNTDFLHGQFLVGLVPSLANMPW